MRRLSIVAMGLVLLLAGGVPASAEIFGEALHVPPAVVPDHHEDGVPASAQMMGGGSGMMGPGPAPAASHCPGMVSEPMVFDYERPWISVALARAQELGLTGDQVKALTALREEFLKEAERIWQDIRAGETALAQLYGQAPINLTAIEAKVKEIAALQAEFRVARVKTIQKGVGLLSDEQRQKLLQPSGTTGRVGA